MGIDGLQPSNYPVHIRQRRARAIASDYGIVSFSDRQVDVAHTDLREIWEGGQRRGDETSGDSTQRSSASRQTLALLALLNDNAGTANTASLNS